MTWLLSVVLWDQGTFDEMFPVERLVWLARVSGRDRALSLPQANTGLLPVAGRARNGNTGTLQKEG